MKAEILTTSTKDPLELARLAGNTCTNGDIKDPIKSLYDPGHLSTFEHWYATFSLTDVPIHEITFGLHMYNNAYTTSQQSGRYVNFFHRVDSLGYNIYSHYLLEIEKLALEAIEKERPKHPNKVMLAQKVAREQLRVFLPISYTTNLLHTLSLRRLLELYRDTDTTIIALMAGSLVEAYPSLNKLFMKQGSNHEVSNKGLKAGILTSPSYKTISMNIDGFTTSKDAYIRLINNQYFVLSETEASIITYSQEQRHRTSDRSLPVFTGNFYLPPLISHLKEEAMLVMNEWIKNGDIKNAPYGAMVKYRKLSNLNAFIDEVKQRLCYRTQEEVFNLAIQAKKHFPFLEYPCSKCKEKDKCYATRTERRTV